MEQTRRTFLQSLGGVSVAVAAGQTVSAQATSEWPMYAADPLNTGHVPETDGPTTDVGPAWEFDTDDDVTTTPAVVDGTVYAGSRDGVVYALDAATGLDQWQFDTGSSVRSSPAVVDGTVYVGSEEGTVYALDAASGDEQWRFGTGRGVRAAPTVVGDTVYVSSLDRRVYAIDRTEGTERWQYQTGFTAESTPAVAGSDQNGTVYVGSNDGTVYALDAATGDEQWTFGTADRIPGSPAVANGTVYIGGQDRSLYALDAESGDEQWSVETEGAIVSSPAVTDSTVYVGSRDHVLYALDAESGDEQWTFDTGRQIATPPAVAGGVVYVGSASSDVFGIDAGSGEELWSFDTGQPVSGGAAVVDGTAYVGSDTGTIYALEDGFAQPPGAATPTPATGGEGGGGAFEPLSFLLLPAALLTVATAIVGGFYVLNRTGMLDPVDSATDTYASEEALESDDEPTDETATSDETTAEDGREETPDSGGMPSLEAAAGESQSPIWQLVLEDVMGRAERSEKTAIEDVVVTKYLDPDTLESPMLAYEIESLRAEPVRVRIREPLVDTDGEPMGDGWTVEGDSIVYETVIDPSETATTLVGRRDCPADDADRLLDKPDVTVDPIE